MADEKKNFDENNEPEIFLLTDETGKESKFELIGETEMDGSIYYAMIPIEEKSDEKVSDGIGGCGDGCGMCRRPVRALHL